MRKLARHPKKPRRAVWAPLLLSIFLVHGVFPCPLGNLLETDYLSGCLFFWVFSGIRAFLNGIAKPCRPTTDRRARSRIHTTIRCCPTCPQSHVTLLYFWYHTYLRSSSNGWPLGPSRSPKLAICCSPKLPQVRIYAIIFQWKRVHSEMRKHNHKPWFSASLPPSIRALFLTLQRDEEYLGRWGTTTWDHVGTCCPNLSHMTGGIHSMSSDLFLDCRSKIKRQLQP